MKKLKKEYDRLRYLNKKQEILARTKKWQLNNKDKDLKDKREYKRLNAVKIKKANKQYTKRMYTLKKAEKIKAVILWRKTNPALVKKARQRHYSSNKTYYKHNAMLREAAKILRTPKWLSYLDLQHIKMFYEAATVLSQETGVNFEVDHIIPLQGKNVCGLHVPWNLQVLTRLENRQKGNKHA